jgi:hypothetical protein
MNTTLTAQIMSSIGKPGDAKPEPTTGPTEWPEPLDGKAYHGVFGELVRAIEPQTEGDPAALLTQALLAVGNIIGPNPFFVAEGTRHRLVLYVVLVGLTSKGRKGSAWNSLLYALRQLEPALDDPMRVPSGLSSGEGLIWSVRDPILSGHIEDPGIGDKRLLVVESEFARVLQTIQREGNTLSAVIRENWDRGNLQVMTKANRAKATGAHISIIGHVTRDELRRQLAVTETANGFANRFLWVCAKRSRLLPDGGDLGSVDFAPIVDRFTQAIDFARKVGELKFDRMARALWHTVYGALSEGQPGMFGAVTSRAEAQVVRLACVYALADQSSVIKAAHLEAALEVWRYCEDSARFIFGGSLGDPVADEISTALVHAGGEGMTRTEIRDLFGRNRHQAEIGRALAFLMEHGRVYRHVDHENRGRPVERWFAVGC